MSYTSVENPHNVKALITFYEEGENSSSENLAEHTSIPWKEKYYKVVSTRHRTAQDPDPDPDQHENSPIVGQAWRDQGGAADGAEGVWEIP